LPLGTRKKRSGSSPKTREETKGGRGKRRGHYLSFSWKKKKKEKEKRLGAAGEKRTGWKYVLPIGEQKKGTIFSRKKREKRGRIASY